MADRVASATVSVTVRGERNSIAIASVAAPPLLPTVRVSTATPAAAGEGGVYAQLSSGGVAEASAAAQPTFLSTLSSGLSEIESSCTVRLGAGCPRLVQSLTYARPSEA